MNRPIICTEIEPVILKNSPTKGRTRWFHRRFLLYTYRLANTYPSETISKIAEGTIPNSFYGAPITLILKPNKISQKRENYRSISMINTDIRILSTNKPNPTMH